MNIIEKVEQYFTDINYDDAPSWYDGDDIHKIEVNDVVSEINSPDR